MYIGWLDLRHIMSTVYCVAVHCMSVRWSGVMAKQVTDKCVQLYSLSSPSVQCCAVVSSVMTVLVNRARRCFYDCAPFLL